MEQSAGTIVIKDNKYLLLHYTAGHWDFAKGHVEAGESLQQTAIRELKEETGLDGEIFDGFEERFRYFFKVKGKLVQKEVVLFVTKVFSDEIVISNEHVGFAWLPIDDAMAKLTFKSSKDALQKAHQWLKGKKEVL